MRGKVWAAVTQAFKMPMALIRRMISNLISRVLMSTLPSPKMSAQTITDCNRRKMVRQTVFYFALTCYDKLFNLCSLKIDTKVWVNSAYLASAIY